MLEQLTIKNYALIQSLEMQPSAKLNIITGETGAGKSIMLGAIGLLLGNRADTKSLYIEDEKCVIEGAFDIKDYKMEAIFEEEDLEYDHQTIIRREIAPSGKSRAFVNDQPVTLEVLKRLGEKLMDIHSQHDNLRIADHIYQLSVLDYFAGNLSSLQAFQSAYSEYTKAKASWEKLKAEAQKIKEEADFVQYQYDELYKAHLKAGEQEELEASLAALENSEEIKLKLNASIDALGKSEFAILPQLAGVQQLLRQIAPYSPQYAELRDRVNSTYIELQDISSELEKSEERVHHDPKLIEDTKDRLSIIYDLQQKHRLATIVELISLQEALKAKVDISHNIEEALLAAEAKTKSTEAEMLQLGKALSETRVADAESLATAIQGLLRQLGMPEAVFRVEVHPKAPDKTGLDTIDFLFSANKGIAPQDIRQVASGGEFSRLMFCIKYVLADKTALPTIIFDEIDTGVSGEVAKKMVGMMKQMAANHQVISISHLPQFAAQGDAHYFVYKDNSQEKTVSKIKLLGNEERVLEIAKMIDGNNPSAAALQSAKEMLG